MNELRQEWLKPYLDELQVSVLLTGHVVERPDWQHTNHIPSNSCMYLILGGEGWIKIRDQEFVPKPGQLFLLPAGELISYHNTPGNTLMKYFCHFHAKVGDLQLFQLLDVPFCLDVQDLPAMIGLFERLNRSFHTRDRYSALRTKAVMYELIARFLEEGGERVGLAPASSGSRLSDVLQYIETHLAHSVTVEQIARAFNYSPKYFFRLFKSYLNTTPHAYINKARMEKAKQLVVSTDLNLDQIAEAIGLERAHFSRLFKQHTGVSPKYFRSVHEAGGDHTPILSLSPHEGNS